MARYVRRDSPGRLQRSLPHPWASDTLIRSATLLVLARGLHEQGDLDAVVDLELVEESGDMALDRRDGEVQRRGDLGVAVAEADGERDVALARAERRQSVAGILGAGAGVRVAGHQRDEPACDRGREHAVAGVDELDC